MNSKILFRSDFDTEEELVCCTKYFPVESSRVNCKDSLVFGRYSVLPYYKELEKDLRLQNSVLVNSYKQHKYIADFNYYLDIAKFTPKTYFNLQDIPADGKFVVKGATNSRKFNWDTMMFAQDRATAIEIACKLSQDSLIQQQNIIVREYVPLITYELGINNQPFTNEWRLFYYKSKLLAYGYYWSLAECAEDPPGIRDFLTDGVEFSNLIARILCNYTNFFVVDIAQTTEGNWIVIEVNDAQMSGLSMTNPDELYLNLKIALEEVDYEKSIDYPGSTC